MYSIALQFLHRVLPPAPGYYASVKAAGGPWRDFYYPAERLSALVGNSLAVAGGGHNTYIALSGYAGPHGRRKVKATAMKALWLDLDCGKPDSPYADAREGVRALGDFCRATGLPLPLTVLSGQGLHLYWTLSQAVTPDLWSKLAGRLRVLCDRHGFQVDHARTCDAASVLRLPGTVNYRDGRARPVKVLHWGQALPAAELYRNLLAQVPELTVPGPVSAAPGPFTAPPGTPLGNLQAAIKNMERSDCDPRAVAAGCRQILGAGRAAYPVWYAAMTVLKHCAGGRGVAHLVSRTDPRYSPEGCDKKFSEAEASGAGPALCETFDFLQPGVCRDCPQRGLISTPLSISDLPRPSKGPEPGDGQAPVASGEAPGPSEPGPVSLPGFNVIPGQGVVWLKPTDESDLSGRPTLINDNEIYIVGIQQDSSGQNLQRRYKILIRSPCRPPRETIYDINEHFGDQPTLKWLGNHGLLPILPKYNKRMVEFMGAYIGAIQGRLNLAEIRSGFGWTSVVNDRGEKLEGFVLPDGVYTEEGIKPLSLGPRPARLGKELARAGDLDAWKKIPAMYHGLNQKEAQLFICAGFAAPLMKFGVGTATNAVLSIWDALGGKGKSTLLRAVNSIWGHPEKLMCGRNDTLSARYQVISTRRNLPVCMDELTAMSDGDLSALLYDLANGREKRKSASSGADLLDIGLWETITCLTSNRSIYELMENYSPQTKAQVMRVIEFPCSFPSYSGTRVGEYIESRIALLDHHYGLAGPEFIRRCFERPGGFSGVQARVRAWDQRARRTADERFWTYSLAIILEAGRLAKEFGLIPYDMDALDECARTTVLPGLRRQVTSEYDDDLGLLVTFFNEHLDQTLVVAGAERDDKHRAGLVSAAGQDPYVKKPPVRNLAGRLELDSLTFYASYKVLSDWCQRVRMSMKMLLSNMRSAGVWDGRAASKVDLGRNVPLLSRGSLRCLRFELNKIAVRGGLDAIHNALETQRADIPASSYGAVEGDGGMEADGSAHYLN